MYLEAKCLLTKKEELKHAKNNLFSCLLFDKDENQTFWVQEIRKFFGDDFEFEYGIFCSNEQNHRLTIKKK